MDFSIYKAKNGFLLYFNYIKETNDKEDFEITRQPYVFSSLVEMQIWLSDKLKEIYYETRTEYQPELPLK